ncbi:Uncharacterised protein [Salmonella enterica]|uniref:Uncharacterized protein n=1 Tax=Salmonella enterica TaxID=28901 RepID=A0A7D8IQL1_SALER|nr:Uncharacterised protein [Salmonella enterica]
MTKHHRKCRYNRIGQKNELIENLNKYKKTVSKWNMQSVEFTGQFLFAGVFCCGRIMNYVLRLASIFSNHSGSLFITGKNGYE